MPRRQDQLDADAKPAEVAIVSAARQRLELHPHFHRHCQTLQIEWVRERLVLSGRLPSFYLKQLAQEALKGLHVKIVNHIDVICGEGLSSTPRTLKPEQARPRKPR